MSVIQEHLTASAALTTRIARTPEFVGLVESAAWAVRRALVAGGTVYAAGNGGSAADAQHFVAELVGRFVVRNRPPLPAVALSTDTSVLTALANDFGYDKVFSRQLTALLEPQDVFVGISTSGTSPSIVEALNECHWRGVRSVLLTSELFTEPEGGVWKDCTVVRVPARETALIQQGHGVILHAICTLVDEGFI